MQKYEGQLLQKFEDGVDGIVAPSIPVVVYKYPSLTLATIYSVDNITSPPVVGSTLQTDSNGKYFFFAEDGEYQLDIDNGAQQLLVQLLDTGTLQQTLAGKVDIEVGKGLSSNDFTGAYRTKVDNIDETLRADVTQGTSSIRDVKHVSSIAALRLLEGKYDGQQVSLSGYYSDSLNGGGMFVWDAASTAADDSGVTIAVAGVATGRWVRQLDGFVTPEMFGQDKSVFNVAANTSNELQILSQFDMGVDGVSITSSLNIEGVGQSAAIIKSTPAASVDYIFTSNANDLKIDDVAIQLSDPAFDGKINNVFDYGAGYRLATNCAMDGGVTINSGTGLRESYANIVTVGWADNSAGLVLRFNDFTRFAYGLLKSNTNTSKQYDIDVSFNKFDDFEAIALLFNSPAVGSLMENIQVIGNKLGSNLSRRDLTGSGSFTHRGSFAGNTNYCRLIGNHATGDGRALFRSEEARSVIMSCNTAKLNGKQGIDIIPNKAQKPTVQVPRYFVVSNNILDHVGLSSATQREWGIGLHSYLTDAEYSLGVLHDSTVHDNVVNSFDVGLKTARGMERNLVHHNVITGCDVGIETFRASQCIDDNIIIDCDTALQFKAGGIIGAVHFRSSLAAVRTAPIAVQVDAGNAVLKNWTYEQSYSIPAVASYTIPIISLGKRMKGRLLASTHTSSTSNRVHEIDIDWDGTTLNISDVFAPVSIGGQVFSSILVENQSGIMHMRCVNASAATGLSAFLQINFEGAHVL